MSDLTQEDYMPLAHAVIAYESARAEGRPGTSEYNAAARLLKGLPEDRRTYWRVQLTTIRQRFGN